MSVNKMAASLLNRLSFGRNLLTNSLITSNIRLFCTKKDGSSLKNDTNKTDKPIESSNSTIEELGDILNDGTQKISKMSTPTATEAALDKFAKVVEKVKAAAQKNAQNNSEPESNKPADDTNESFATMLRKSHLMSLGDVTGRLVEGKIFEVMGDDLYIDFGGKFHCVCPRPKTNGNLYHRGTKVVVSLQCLEMSSAFLGSDIHITLLEADGTLMGLSSTKRNRSSQKTS